eukprot:TRINITY_DN17185_c0_g1_i1.p2 TRINITY_DN17185_c0_g1~~TRINITY_DN17185_c0_g1_i1.p2  ORF type:complete len:202 (-),score=58.64 TRINITY_DN17185_c0_g1_i1:43-648(-)
MANPSATPSSLWPAGTPVQGVEKGARWAKLLKASERLVSCAVADVLKQDFNAAFKTVLPPGQASCLPQMKTRMAATFSDAAQQAQAQAMKDEGAFEMVNQLDEKFYGEATTGSIDALPLHELERGRANPVVAVQERLRSHERCSKIELLRKHLMEQERENEKQEQVNKEMRAKIQAIHQKLDRDTAALMAPLVPFAGQAGA